MLGAATTSFVVGALVWATLVVVVADDVLTSPVDPGDLFGQRLCVLRTGPDETAASAGRIAGGAAAAASLASWLSLRAISSCV